MKCRNCKSSDLLKVLSLGNQMLTGVFPKSKDKKITKGPLDLVLCNNCKLLQLGKSYDLLEMYGDNYGYRSGLNQSMVDHLEKKINSLETLVSPNENDIVIDIGSNDATSLKAYKGKFLKVGIDPTGNKFLSYYNNEIRLIPNFFSANIFKKIFHDRKAKIITSIAMFYDLEDPNKFVKDINDCLEFDGIWHFEQSYMPQMLKSNSYDTICHEHLEFYSLTIIKEILENNHMKIIDVEINSVNGGSIAITAVKNECNAYKINESEIKFLLDQENLVKLNTLKPYKDFSSRIIKHKENLVKLINEMNKSGKKVFGYGASTKGNVLLQYCGFTSKDLPFIAEVNKEKFGLMTPGTYIPIISEDEAKNLSPDYFLVLPWHFRDFIIKKEKKFLESGGKLIFPLPIIEIY